MAKTTTAGMDTHLAGDVTTLAMAVLITRTDGQQFRFTTSSEAIGIDIGDGLGEQTYLPNEGVGRSNIASDSELTVDNLDVVGVFDNAQLDETELRRGLFDFADFRIFVYNHRDKTDGIIKIFRGELGEVITTPLGFFKVTLRSLVQVYSKETGEHYSKDCRADLGDIRCRVPLYPEPDPTDAFDRTFPVSFISPSTTYQLGDFVMIPTAVDPSASADIILNGEGTDGSTTFTNEGTEGNPDQVAGNTQIDTAQAPAGGDSTSSILFDGSGDILRWLDAAWNDIGTNPFTIQAWIRLNTAKAHTIFSKYEATTSDRVFHFSVSNTGVLSFSWYLDGVNLAGSINSGATTISTGTNTHVAVTRDAAGDIRLFIGGTQVGSTVNETGSFHNSNERLRIGALESGFTETNFFDGWIDSFEFINGAARWDAAFAPPTGNLTPSATPFNELPWEDFGDRIYEVTTAGASGAIINSPDTGIGNTHSQGTAVLTANHSWMRFAEVTAVGSNPRKEFTVTELTPNSGQAVGSNRTPSSLGFPDDWFNGGAVHFDTGDNAGVSREVVDFVADDGVTITQDIIMFDAFPFNVQVGDKLRIFPGCDKLNATCIAKFNNGPNFVGEPYVPGEDILGQYPDARG